MPSNQHLLLHGLRLLVLAIALVLVPAGTAAVEYSAAETPVLVLSLARDLEPTAHRIESPESPRDTIDSFESTWPPRPLALGLSIDTEPYVSCRSRYLVYGSWLC